MVFVHVGERRGLLGPPPGDAAGDVVELDGIEQLLVNLKKKGVLSKSEILVLQGRYLQERRAQKRST